MQYYIRQITDTDCGFTALKILLANIYQKSAYLFLKEDEKHGNYSYLELIEIAHDYGVVLDGVEIEDPDLDNLNNYPFLATLKYSEDSSHLVYVSGITKRNVLILDPSLGKTKLSRKKFLELWDQTALFVESKNEVKELEKRSDDVGRKPRIVSILLQIFSLGSLITGCAFIEENAYIFIPIACFALYVILELILHQYLIKNMRRIDDLYINQLEELPINNEEFIKRLSYYKKDIFSSPIEFISNVITIIVLTSVMLLNNPYTGVEILVVIILILISYSKNKEQFKRKAVDISSKEIILKDTKELKTFKEGFFDLEDSVYQYTKLNNSSTYIVYFIILLSTLLSMLLTKVVSLPFILIYFVFGLTIYRSFLKAMDYPENIENSKVSYMRLLNIMH